MVETSSTRQSQCQQLFLPRTKRMEALAFSHPGENQQAQDSCVQPELIPKYQFCAQS